MRRLNQNALLGAAALAMASQGASARMPTADKLIGLVPGSCDWATLSPRLDRLGTLLSDDRRTTRVSIDRPADAERNLDLMGRPSPFLAAIEVSARSSALRGLSGTIGHGLGAECPVNLYLVHERRLLTTPRTWALGSPAPTSKTLVTLRRKQGLSFEGFDREWASPHAELALSWRKARGGDSHYVQNLVVGTLGRGTPPLDGIGESEGPAVTQPSEIERKARIETAKHAQTFQDSSSSQMFVTRETLLKD